MPILSKFVYSGAIDPKKTFAGLINDQRRIDAVITNATWFSKSDRLGKGDLSMKDLDRISKSIPKEEVFFILSELDGFLDVPSGLDPSSPGFDYIVSNALYVVVSNLIVRIYNKDMSDEPTEKDGVKFLRMARTGFFKSINYTPKKTTSTTASPPKKLKKVDSSNGGIVKTMKSNPASVSNVVTVTQKVGRVPAYPTPIGATKLPGTGTIPSSVIPVIQPKRVGKVKRVP